jgi:hypothetical protein
VRCDISFSFVQHFLRQLIYHYWSSYTEESYIPVLWTYHGYGLCWGRSWTSYRGLNGQLYLFQNSCSISARVDVPFASNFSFSRQQAKDSKGILALFLLCCSSYVVEELHLMLRIRVFTLVRQNLQETSYLVCLYQIQELSLIF